MAVVSPMSNGFLPLPTSTTNKPAPTSLLPTLFTALFLALAFFANNLALAWIHERVPASDPLPDLWFTLFPEIPGAIRITELIMIALAITALIVLVCHQHRVIVARRVFFCCALCYAYRALAITIIQVPVPSKSTYCSPKTEGGISVLLSRVATTFWSIGIEQLRPRVPPRMIIRHFSLQDLCGDLIISGHTITIFMALHTFKQYSPRKMWPISYVLNLLAVTGIICILLARKHYMIDVCLAYFLSTQVFWTYHSLAESWHTQTLERNSLSQTWWARAVPLLEQDAPPPHLLLNRLQWPSSCPQRVRRW